MAVHEAAQHARSGGVANGCGNVGHLVVGSFGFFAFHTLMLNEAWKNQGGRISCMKPEHVLAAASHADPYAFYAQLLSGPPLAYDAAHRFWIASSAAAVKTVLSHPDCHVRPAAEPVPAAIAGSSAGEVFGHLMRMNEGERHGRPRLVLQRFLASVDMALLRQRTRFISATAASQGILGSAAGLSRWILDVPVMVVADLLGFAEDELEQVAGWMKDFVACLSALSDAAQLAAASVAAQALMARFAELLAAAEAWPGSAVAAIQQDAARAGWAEKRALLANLVGLLSQTFEATAGLLGNSIVALAGQSDIASLIHDHQRLLALVNEVSRHDPSIHNTRRFVARPLDLMGARLQAGDCILLVLAAAGRDAACFPQPDAFMLSRPDNGLPGFGHGRHQCPGQQIACTIAVAALGTLLEKGLHEVLPKKWIYRPSVNARVPVFLD